MIKLYVFLAVTLSLVLLPTARAETVRVKAPSLSLDLSTSKVAHVKGEVNPEMLAKFIKEMDATAAVKGDRVIVINSPGGIETSGRGIIARIEEEQRAGTRVICVVVGKAYSMAANILTRCSLRLAEQSSLAMFHKLALMTCPPGRLTAKNLQANALELEQEDEQYRQANSLALGMSLVEYDHYADEDAMWSAPTLLKRKYLHALLSK